MIHRCAIFLAILTTIAASALEAQDQFIPRGVHVLKGYVKPISGEVIGYHSFHPSATHALLTRATDGNKTIEWETEPLPTNYRNRFAYFVWIAGHSSGTSTGDRSFDLFVNGSKWFTFKTTARLPVRSWNLTGPGNSELSFHTVWLDQLKDVYGYMCLRVSTQNLKQGEPFRLKAVGEKAGSNDWYMTFQYAMAESVEVSSQPALVSAFGRPRQLVDVSIDHASSDGLATVSGPGVAPITRSLKLGLNLIEVPFPAVKQPQEVTLTVSIEGLPRRKESVSLRPVKQYEFYFLPHSHNDIGYSDTQPDVEKKQLANLSDAVALWEQTAGYPTEARSRWNSEILWAVESYMKKATDAQRADFIDAVKQGGIGLQALYANPLTGICRPEELYHLTDYARELSSRYGITINSAMVSDVPGFTWSIVPALAQCGVKYFSSGPNYVPSMPDGGDRVGFVEKAWADKPFYWNSPSGNEKILFWMAGKGYSWFHGWIIGKAGGSTRQHLFDYLNELDAKGYPYDMVQIRYTIVSDNGPIDPDLPAFVKEWNKKYVSPKIVIATSSQMFEEFEKRYSGSIPSYSGDLTPYWEDGALSTAAELMSLKASTERLIQAEVLTSMIAPDRYQGSKFYDAWRNVNLFDEHTWGAWNSISEPDSPFVLTQWNIKRQYALDADRESKDLLETALGVASPGRSSSYEVINTNSWPRTDIVILSKGQSSEGDKVRDQHGTEVPSQRLSDGSLAFLAGDVPALGSARYSIGEGHSAFAGTARAEATRLTNGSITLTIQPSDGSIRSMLVGGTELVDSVARVGLNGYVYVPGRDPAAALGDSDVSISLGENGPLIASLKIVSHPRGCKSFEREIRVVDGVDRIDIFDRFDKKKIREKEGLHIAFPWNIQGGVIRTDNGWGVVRPEEDQLAGSCKDFISSQRWVDLSNQSSGVTWSTDYSALIEVGQITNEMQTNNGVRAWRKTIEPSSTFYSYVMNNYWHTNYKADQEGAVTIRYAFRPHGPFSAPDAYRFGIETNQPLLVRAVDNAAAETASLVRLTPDDVAVTSLRPCSDGRGLMMRLFNTGGSPVRCRIVWNSGSRREVFQSSVFEERGPMVEDSLSLPAWGIVTLRCEQEK